VGGDVKTCAGSEVLLFPATEYNLEKLAAVKRGERPTGPVHLEADKYMKKGICDAQGRFSFKDLPALKWYVATDVEWSVPSRYSLERQGGQLRKTVELVPGANEVILTGDDR
jgi:hypothetical protein